MLLGTAVTAVIQSSSATSAMVVGFVNSGMMKLSQAIGIVLGANIGTSVTGWILCLSYISSSDALSLLSSATITAIAAIAGILLRMLGKTSQKRHTGDILLGFAVLMYGMNAMSGAVSPLRESEGFLRLMTMFENPILGVLIGTLITAVLQSNSASVGILQALSVTWNDLLCHSLPDDHGHGHRRGGAGARLRHRRESRRRRTALIYLFTGIFGTVIFSALFYGVNAFSPFPFMETALGPVGIAMVNSLFRIGSILILFPFLRQLEALTGKLIPEKTSEKYNELTAGIERLEERFLVHPALAIEQCRLTINAMAMRSQDNLVVALELIKNFSQKGFQQVVDMEDAVDQYEDHLGTYLVKFTGRELSTAQNEEVSKFLHTIGDFERISDHAMNLAEVAREIYEKDIRFTDAAQRELDVLRTAVSEIVSLVVGAFIGNDLEMALRVEPLEDTIDGLCDEMKLHHIIRLQDGSCTLAMGFVFNDLLTNYERIADHCSNIAVAMIELESDSFDTHEYLKSLREMKTQKYMQYAEEYGKKFAL